MPAPKRFHFLKRADFEMCNLRQKYSDKIRENSENFYQLWAMLIEETVRFILTGIETLEFQARCPAHMLVEHSQKFPSFKWMATQTDLAECIVGIYQTDVIRLHDGSRPSFVQFAKFIGDFFGITYKYLYSDIGKLLTRKKGATPFLLRIIESIKNRNIKMDGLKD
jgi:hypothetical protein